MRTSVSAIALLMSTSSLLGQTTLASTANRYCVACHNDKLRTAGLSLDSVDTAGTDVLEKVLRKLRAGEMPPPGMPSPDTATRSSVVRSLEAELDTSAR